MPQWKGAKQGQSTKCRQVGQCVWAGGVTLCGEAAQASRCCKFAVTVASMTTTDRTLVFQPSLLEALHTDAGRRRADKWEETPIQNRVWSRAI